MIFPTLANGNIIPMRFIQQDTSGDSLAIQATLGSKLIGISQRGTRRPPGTFFNNDGFCAIQGESFQLYSAGETCLVELGATVTPGDYLMSDSVGRAITAVNGSGYYYGAIAGQGANGAGVGQLIEVQVVFGIKAISAA